MNKDRQVVLVVDDVEMNIDVLLEALGRDYVVRVAMDGEAALRSVAKSRPDLILLDVMMPRMDGFEVCRRLKADSATRQIPIIFLTALSEDADESRGLDLGAVDYITKPFNPAIARARVRNHLELKKYEERLENLVKLRTYALECTKDATIASMAFLAEYRDPETGGHIERTKHYIRCMAEDLSGTYPGELTPETIDLLAQSAPLHDIGKVGIPDAILLKSSELTEEEFAQVKRHTLIGSAVIRKTEAYLGTNSFLRIAREIAEFHHERWDGSGYPHGLKGEEIPPCARLMAIADIYDALVTGRPYKPPYSYTKAYTIITRGDGYTKPEHFSPVVLQSFERIRGQWEGIAERFRD